MLEQQGILALIAIGLGFIAGLFLFVPFIWFNYRRHGGLSGGKIALSAVALIYFWAIWTYTLLPLPEPATLRCAGTNLNPALFLTEINEALSESGGSVRALLTHQAILQLALNVLLFVPLGFFLRVLGQRGWVTALLTGAGLSLLIETTQLTGVWGLYDCAYRVFDVNDMMTNATGAVLGSLLALLVPRRWRSGDAELPPEKPRPVTRGRRLLAMISDVLAFTLLSGGITVALRVVLLSGLDRPDLVIDSNLTSTIGLALTLAGWFCLTMITGRTVGDFAVRLVYRGGPLPVFVARFFRLLGGIGLYGALLLLPEDYQFSVPIFALVAIACALFTSRGSGLPGLLSRQALMDERAVAPEFARESRKEA